MYINMDTLFDLIKVNASEFEYFKKLEDDEQVIFMLQLFDQAFMTSNGIDLSGFFSSIQNVIVTETMADGSDTETTIFEDAEYANDPNRCDVMIDEDNIMIESNSLKAVKHIAYKFAESGYILRRDFESEKMFKKDKLTRYLRIFYIVDQVTSICTN